MEIVVHAMMDILSKVESVLNALSLGAKQQTQQLYPMFAHAHNVNPNTI